MKVTDAKHRAPAPGTPLGRVATYRMQVVTTENYSSVMFADDWMRFRPHARRRSAQFRSKGVGKTRASCCIADVAAAGVRRSTQIDRQTERRSPSNARRSGGHRRCLLGPYRMDMSDASSRGAAGSHLFVVPGVLSAALTRRFSVVLESVGALHAARAKRLIRALAAGPLPAHHRGTRGESVHAGSYAAAMPHQVPRRWSAKDRS
jgi:hypothetical protein